LGNATQHNAWGGKVPARFMPRQGRGGIRVGRVLLALTVSSLVPIAGFSRQQRNGGNDALASLQELVRVGADGSLRDELAAAEALLQLHAPQVAAARLLNVIRRHPESREAWTVLVQAQSENGAFTTAAATLHRALKRWPGDRDLLYQQATVAITLGEEEEAREILQRLTRQWPQFAAAQYSLAVVENDRGSYSIALRHLDAAQRIVGVSAQTALLRGLLLEQLHHLTEAEGALRDAVRLAPDRIAAHVALARVLAREGKAGSSAQERQHVAELSATRSGSEKRRAQVAALTQQGEQAALANQLPAALTTYNAALDLDSSDVASHLGKGKVLYSIRHFPEARQEFQAALQSDPVNPEAHYLLGLVSERLHDTTTSRAEYALALALHPGDAESALALIRLLRAAGQEQAAMRVLAAARAANPSDPELAAAKP